MTIPILLVRCYHGPYLAEKTFVISWHRPYIAILVVYFPSFTLTSKPIKIERVTDLSRVARFVKKACTITNEDSSVKLQNFNKMKGLNTVL